MADPVPGQVRPLLRRAAGLSTTRVGGEFYVRELETLRDDLAGVAGRPVTDDDLRASIAVYNENRRAVRELYAYRAQKPWQAPTAELYLVLRAGNVLPPEAHTDARPRVPAPRAEAEKRPKRDNARVVVTGSFCEQPPLGLIKSIEMAGCYIVDDDFMLVHRWLLDDVPADGDPLDEPRRGVPAPTRSRPPRSTTSAARTRASACSSR